MSQCQINYDYFRCRNLHTRTQHLQSTSTEVSKRTRSLLLFTPTPSNFGKFMVINPSKLKIQFKRDFVINILFMPYRQYRWTIKSAYRDSAVSSLSKNNEQSLSIDYIQFKVSLNVLKNPILKTTFSVSMIRLPSRPMQCHPWCIMTLYHTTHTTLDQSPQGSTKRPGGLKEDSALYKL